METKKYYIMADEIEETDREIASLQKFLSYEKELERMVYARLDRHIQEMHANPDAFTEAEDRFEGGFFEYFSTNSQIAITRLECQLESLQNRRQNVRRKKRKHG
jgi:hypothetical protein